MPEEKVRPGEDLGTKSVAGILHAARNPPGENPSRCEVSFSERSVPEQGTCEELSLKS